MGEQTKLRVVSLIIKAALFSVGLSGILVNVVLGGPVALLYFTIQSNLFMVVATMPFIIEDILVLAKRTSFIKGWLRMVKYMATFSVTVTFLVFTFLLIPQVSLEFLASYSNYSVHAIVPILALVDFFLFDKEIRLNRLTCLMPLICPACYFVIFLIGSVSGVRYLNDSFAPYFFLNYQAVGWFTVSEKGLGTFYWFLILFIFFGLLSYVFLFFVKLRKGELFRKKEIK